MHKKEPERALFCAVAFNMPLLYNTFRPSTVCFAHRSSKMKLFQITRSTPMFGMRLVGFSLITPFVFSLAWIFIPVLIPDRGYVALSGGALGCFALMFSLANFDDGEDEIEGVNTSIFIFLLWVIFILFTDRHGISVTRTTVLITTVIWAIIFAEAFVRFMKEKTEIALPRGPIA